MTDFNWINAVPARAWSIPDRGWSVLAISRREFARKSGLENDAPFSALFSEWTARQIHRNYALLCDDVNDDDGTVFIAMRGNPVISHAKEHRVVADKQSWRRPASR